MFRFCIFFLSSYASGSPNSVGHGSWPLTSHKLKIDLEAFGPTFRSSIFGDFYVNDLPTWISEISENFTLYFRGHWQLCKIRVGKPEYMDRVVTFGLTLPAKLLIHLLWGKPSVARWCGLFLRVLWRVLGDVTEVPGFQIFQDFRKSYMRATVKIIASVEHLICENHFVWLHRLPGRLEFD